MRPALRALRPRLGAGPPGAAPPAFAGRGCRGPSDRWLPARWRRCRGPRSDPATACRTPGSASPAAAAARSRRTTGRIVRAACLCGPTAAWPTAPRRRRVTCWFIPTPFLTCLRCGVVYTRREGRLSQAGPPVQRGAQHGHDPARQCRRSTSCAATDLDRRGPQAAQLHRQPPGRLAPGRPLQRLCRGRPALRDRPPRSRPVTPDRPLDHAEIARGGLRDPWICPRRPMRTDPADTAGPPGATPRRCTPAARVPYLRGPAPRLAGHPAQPGAVRPAAHRLPGSPRSLSSSRAWDGHHLLKQSSPVRARARHPGAARSPAPRTGDRRALSRREQQVGLVSRFNARAERCLAVRRSETLCAT